MSGPEKPEFLARWSRRKSAARAGEADAEPADAAETAPAETGDSRSDAEILEGLGLPDPDTLGAGSDFRPFMAAAVPARLRSRALRALWRSNPRLANLDGLVDHGEDFSDRATVVPGLRTAYQVGRGMLRRVADDLDKDEAAPESGTAPPEEPPADEPEVAASEPVAAEPEPAGVPDQPRKPPRRMRFEVQAPPGEPSGDS